MAKRFTDTEIWTKEWYLDLSLVQKLLVKFLFDNCDCAGIYEPNYRILSFMFGEKITEQDILSIPKIIKLENGNFFIQNFIKFQYGVEIEELNSNFSVHKGIIAKLNKNNVLTTLTKGLDKSLKTVNQTLQDKDMDKDKDNIQLGIEEEKENKEKEEKKSILFSSNSNLLFDKNVNSIFKLYKEYCKDLLPLKFEERDLVLRQEIKNFLELIDDNLSYFKDVCIKANKLIYIVNRKIDIKSLINNHTRIDSGFYIKTDTKKNDLTKTQEELEQDRQKRLAEIAKALQD